MRNIYWVLATTLFIFSACGRPNEYSLKGHYEDSDKLSAEKYRAKQTVVPEYSPTRAVIVSLPVLSLYNKEELVQEILNAGAEEIFITVEKNSGINLNSPVFRNLRSLLGSDINRIHLVEQGDSGSITVWARDWSPLGARANDITDPAKKLRYLDLNYYPYRKADDAAGRALETLYAYSRVSVPVYNEGGNFMVNDSGDCLMTTRVVDANSSKSRPDDIILSAQEIKKYYQDFAGCRSVFIFQRIPDERTGHIDMWVKFINNETIIVSELRDSTIALLSGTTLSRAKIIQSYLNERANELAGLGFNIKRIPMPAPESGVYRSYTNSLIVNDTVLVPRYFKPAYKIMGSYPDKTLLSDYEHEVTQIYEDEGYKVKFLDSDALISNGGAIHCVTMQIPNFAYASPK